MIGHPFTCDVCGAEVDDLEEYIEHVAQELGEVDQEVPEWPTSH